MSDDGWIHWMTRPPYTVGVRDGVLVPVPDYEVIEWRRWSDPADKEPNVANVRELAGPQNQAWNVHGVVWRPVL